MPTIDLHAGPVHYETTGPRTGRPVVFVHGYTMSSSLWGPLAERLAASGLHCIIPTWPLGSQPEPMRPGADVTLPGIAAMVDDLLTALDLDDVVLVGADTGGVVAQLVSVEHPRRIGTLVLTSCDAFENFPPPILKPFMLAARTQASFRAALQPMRSAAVRRRAFGDLAHTDIAALTAAWVRPALDHAGVAADLRRLTASLDRRITVDVAARLGEYTGPALIAWSADDTFFPVEHAHRLGAAFPNAQVTMIEHARTFSMIDQPDRLAEVVASTAG